MLGKMDCYIKCEEILEQRNNGIIKRVINKQDPWCKNPLFLVEHIKGSSKTHYIIGRKKAFWYVIIHPVNGGAH